MRRFFLSFAILSSYRLLLTFLKENVIHKQSVACDCFVLFLYFLGATMKSAINFVGWFLGCALSIIGACILIMSNPLTHRMMTSGWIMVGCGIAIIVGIIWEGKHLPPPSEKAIG